MASSVEGSATATITPRPLWRRVVDFPLVALLIGFAAMLGSAAAVGALLGWLPVKQLPKGQASAVAGLALVLVSVALCKLLIARLGERPRDDLPFDRRSTDAARGTVVAALLMSGIVALVALLGGYRISGWGGSADLAWLLFSVGLQAAFFEEILIRGVLFRFLEEFGGSWFALAVSSALFGFGHIFNDNATVFSSLAIAVEAGLMLGGAYMLTRNLWLAIGLHFGWNFTQGYIWDVPVSGNAVDGLVASHPAGPALVSGGLFGLEASVIALAIATPLGVWFVYRAALKGHLVRPWWVRRRLAREAAAA